MMLIFSLTLILGTCLAVSSSMWLTIWMGLELNLMSMIPILTFNSKSDTPMKYFMLQALASSMLLMGILISFLPFLWPFGTISHLIITISLLTKLGAAPFHFWLPSIMNNTNWMNCLILVTWQKIAPLFLLLTHKSFFLVISITFSALIGALGGFNQTSVRKIMAYSSIGHLSWLLAASMTNEPIFLLYFLIYIMISSSIIIYFYINKIMFTPQILDTSKSNLINMMFFMNLMSLGGLPPMLGFLPKWQVFIFLINNNLIILSIVLFLASLVTLFYYLRISYYSFMFSQTPLLFKTTISYMMNMIILTPSILGFPFIILFL